MSNSFALVDLLADFVQRSAYTPGQLARLTGVPKATIVNWLEGRVQKPRHWDMLLQVAAALRLTEAEATRLLQAGGHPSVEELLRSEDSATSTLFDPWRAAIHQRAHAPFQALADLPYFIGRTAELQAIRQILLGDQPTALCVLQGMGGVGKSVLAARAAYQLRPYFPDGVLWTQVDKAEPLATLTAFAQAYGLSVNEYPDVESRSQVVRDLLAHKRALLVLDNAESSAQLQPLLPPTGHCAVIITTRRHDLALTLGAQRISVGEFAPDTEDALALFIQIMGADVVAQEQAVLAQIADLLGHLPLALAIVASRLAYEPNWWVADFLHRLQTEKVRLNALTCDDRDVRASFAVSYQALSPVAQRFFAALGVFSSEDFRVEAAAYVTQLSTDEAHTLLRKLYSLSLVQQGRPGRYRLHPLLCDYALEQLADEAVFVRMVGFYVQYAQQHQGFYDRLDEERVNLLTMLEVAHTRALPDLLMQGVTLLAPFLEARGLYAVGILHLQRAVQAAQAQGTSSILVDLLCHLGEFQRHANHYANAEAVLQAGLAQARQNSYEEGIVRALISLSSVGLMSNHHAQVEGYLHEALALATRLENAQLRCSIYINWGAWATNGGNKEQAETAYQAGLRLARQVGNHYQISMLLYYLGDLNIKRQAYAQAEVYLQEALLLAQAAQHQRGMSFLLRDLGTVASAQGEHNQAEAYFQESLALARTLNNRWLIADILNTWGDSYLAQQRWDEAWVAFQEAVTETSSAPAIAGEAHFGLAQVAAARSDLMAAHQQAQQSLAILRSVCPHRAEVVEQWLVTTGSDGCPQLC